MLPVIGPGLLVWSYKEIQFVAVSAGPGCMQNEPGCIPRLLSALGPAKVSEIPEIFLRVGELCLQSPPSAADENKSTKT